MPETQLSSCYYLASSGLVLYKNTFEESYDYTIAGTRFCHREAGPSTLEIYKSNPYKTQTNYFDAFIPKHKQECFTAEVPMHFLADWVMTYDNKNYDFIGNLPESILNYYTSDITLEDIKNKEVVAMLRTAAKEYSEAILDYHKQLIRECKSSSDFTRDVGIDSFYLKENAIKQIIQLFK